MIYTFSITANLGKTFTSVEKVVESVNEIMYGFGFNEKIKIVGQIATITVTSNCNLTTAELLKIGQFIKDTLERKLPECELDVELKS